MKKYKFRIFLFVLIAATVYAACRKTDQRHDDIVSLGEIEAKFFNSHPSNEPLVRFILNFMKGQNNKYNSVEKMVTQIGYPYWDKAITVSKAGGSGRGASDSEHITYIPFVRDSQNFVNASLVVKTTPTDTSYKFLCDWQYTGFGFDSASTGWNARDVFHVFARLDKQVFERTDFIIKNENLLTQQEKNHLAGLGMTFSEANVVYHIEPGQNVSGRNNLLMPVTVCDDIYTCIGEQTAAKSNTPNRTSIVPGSCTSGTWLITTVCTEVWVYIPSGGSGGGLGGTGGGGSGGGSGGGLPPGCGGVTNRNNLTDSCGPGWVPTGGGGSNPPPNDSTIVKNLKKLLLKAIDSIKNIPDSLHNKAQQDGNERAFTFVKTGTDTTVNWIMAGNSHSSSPTLNSHSIGFLHTHQEDDPVGGTDKNQCFDGPDIYKLYKNAAIDGYPIDVSIITTRDYYYAAVITDIEKFKNYIRTICNSLDIKVIYKALNNLHIDAMDNCSTAACTWQKKSEMGVLAITANNNASISGIKIFRSPRQNINFTLLTP